MLPILPHLKKTYLTCKTISILHDFVELAVFWIVFWCLALLFVEIFSVFNLTANVKIQIILEHKLIWRLRGGENLNAKEYVLYIKWSYTLLSKLEHF